MLFRAIWKNAEQPDFVGLLLEQELFCGKCFTALHGIEEKDAKRVAANARVPFPADILKSL